MRLFKRILAAFVAVLAGLAVSAGTAYAGTITVTPPSGTESGQQTTYQLYKVFVASGSGEGISYHTVNTGDVIRDSNGTVLTHSKDWNLPDVAGTYSSEQGKAFDSSTLPSFVFDTTGEIHWATIRSGAPATVHTNADNSTVNTYDSGDLTDADTTTLPDYAVHAIANYIRNDSPIQTVHANGIDSVTFDDVSNGYYYVTTTTGTAVSVTSANPNATIDDKNEVPTLTKIIESVTNGSVQSDGKRAIAEVGSTVTYRVTVNFNSSSNSNGVADNVVLHDTLQSGLTLTGTPSVVFNAGANGQADTGGKYEVKQTPDTGDSLTIDFTGSSSSVASATVTYTATVDRTGLTSDDAALKNSAYLTYGSNTPKAETAKVSTSVYNATYTVTKVDGANQPLTGAGFLLYKKGNGDKRYYYRYDSATNTVSWVEAAPQQISGSSEMETYENAARRLIQNDQLATAVTTLDDNGNATISFTGLSNGEYYLYELDAPTGYRRGGDAELIVKQAHETDAFTASNLLQIATVTNVPGSQLPTTGDVGTTLLYVAGGCLILGGAAIILSRKMRAK